MRDSLALRERVADFAAEAQGLEAAELFLAAFGDVRRWPARCASDARATSRAGAPSHQPFFLKPQPRFVTVRGGEYLYRPGMRALRWLVAGGVAPAQGL